MGVVGMLAPEAAGGLGLTTSTWCRCSKRRAGRVPVPIVETAAVGVPLLGDREAGRSPTAHGSCRGPTPPMSCSPATAASIPRRCARCRARRSTAPATCSRCAATAIRSTGSWLAFDRGALGTAAQLSASDRMLDLTVEYVKERHQFGVPVGSFQAVKHHLANAPRARVRAAARATARRSTLDAGPHGSMAKAMADAAALLAARVALQCHGAIGYTVEYDLHLCMKRTWALRGAGATRAPCTGSRLDRAFCSRPVE